MPGIKIVKVEEATLLGSPLHDAGIPGLISQKIEALNLVRTNLKSVGSHVSLFLLKNCFLMPKFLYSLRTAPVWRFQRVVENFDGVQREILEETLNVPLSDVCWEQATLPVSRGGLGVRKADSLALPAYFASLSASQDLVDAILPIHHPSDRFDGAAVMKWRQLSGTAQIPAEPARQRAWDELVVRRTYNSLLEGSTNATTRARLLGVSGSLSGAWLEALPISAIGTKLDDESTRIAVGLRLGTRVCLPHTCRCSAEVCESGLHGLDCRKSVGRFSRHSEINSIIHRSLSTINKPSILEPVGMTRSDGRRPDGMTLFPWENGKPLVWDATCVSTLAPSNLDHSLRSPGGAASEAEGRKRSKYEDLSRDYLLTPLGFETVGHWGKSAVAFVDKLGRELGRVTGEPRSTSYLRQRLSVAIQRGNTASVRGTVTEGDRIGEIFYLPFNRPN